MLGRVFVLPARPGLLGVLLTHLGHGRQGGGRGALLTSWFFSFSCELTFLFLSQGALVQPADCLLPVSKALASVLPSPFRGEVCVSTPAFPPGPGEMWWGEQGADPGRV